MPKSLKALLVVIIALFILMFWTVGFLCLTEGAAGMFAVMLIFPVAMIGLIGLNVWDFDRDLIDISNGKVQVVNYFFGIKRERAASISDIANIEKLDSRSFKLLIHGRGLKYHSYYYVTQTAKTNICLKYSPVPPLKVH